MREQGIPPASDERVQIRVFDATTVKEPGKTGSLWRLHYSVRLPSFACDHFKLTETTGPGTGESLTQFPLSPGRSGGCGSWALHGGGMSHVASAGVHATVRINTGSLAFTRPVRPPCRCVLPGAHRRTPLLGGGHGGCRRAGSGTRVRAAEVQRGHQDCARQTSPESEQEVQEAQAGDP